MWDAQLLCVMCYVIIFKKINTNHTIVIVGQRRSECSCDEATGTVVHLPHLELTSSRLRHSA